MPEKYIVNPSSNINGTISVPGDKSISHRSLILLSISEGIGKISGLLESEDCLATLNIFKKMGIEIIKDKKNSYTINGKGLNGLKKPMENLNCGNSGTSMRLLAGLLSAQNFSSCLIGDESLTKRPMQRISLPLLKMGADIRLSKNKTAPININPSKKISSIEYNMPIDSAQIKSSIILASIYASSESKIIENVKTRNHTENIINYLNGRIENFNNEIIVYPNIKLTAKDIDVPGDISSAMYIIVGCIISKKSEVIIKNVGLNELRIGGIEILRLMGAKIEIKNVKSFGLERVGDIYVCSSKLTGISIPDKYIASAIDEFPILFIAAASASGKTIIRNARELKYKESDRLSVMSEGLIRCKINNILYEDGIEIDGGKVCGGIIDSHGDHRIAMSFSIAGIISKEPIIILNTENISTSFPNFYRLVKDMGLNIEREF